MSGPPDLPLGVLHFIEYLGLLGGIGCFVVRRLGRLRPRIPWADPPMHVAFAVATIGGLGLFALGPTWPLGARAVAEGTALVLCLRGKGLVALFAAIAVVLLPITSHASTVPEGAVQAEIVDVVHIFSAGMWAGAILALASLAPPGGWGGEQARSLLERFARVALIAFGVTALTGVLRATEQLPDVIDLWSTAYGMVLLVKIAAVLATLTLSLAWRRGRPVARFEAVAVGVVVAATALLAAFPFPAGLVALSR